MAFCQLYRGILWANGLHSVMYSVRICPCEYIKLQSGHNSWRPWYNYYTVESGIMDNLGNAIEISSYPSFPPSLSCCTIHHSPPTSICETSLKQKPFYNWECEKYSLYGEPGCPFLRVSYEVYGETVRTFRIVYYTVGACCWRVSFKRSCTVLPKQDLSSW